MTAGDFDERRAFADDEQRDEFAPPRSARWHVCLVVEGEAWRDAWKHVDSVWATSSTDAVSVARSNFYGLWATHADRERYPLRVVEVRQVSV